MTSSTESQPSPTGEPGSMVPLVEVGCYPDLDTGFEHALVIAAWGRPYCLSETPEGFRLLVDEVDAPEARRQLGLFTRERKNWPPPTTAPLETVHWHRGLFLTPLLWGLSLLAVFRLQIQSGTSLRALGGLDAEAVFTRKEYWRAFTALFLHADGRHLTSNFAFGIFAFTAVLSVFGVVGGWLRLVAAGIMGNLAIAALHHPEPYASSGASTAVLGALGLLTGRAARSQLLVTTNPRWRSILIPIATGATIFGYFGMGEYPTDVGAHAMGFAAGALIGAVVPLKRK